MGRLLAAGSLAAMFTRFEPASHSHLEHFSGEEMPHANLAALSEFIAK
jgi:hypothetical protein